MATPREGKSLEAIAVKRTTLADAGKVRYRVYSSETEFVAVIAESALMAMKISGISTPHHIVRDLPHESVAIEAKRIAQEDAQQQRVLLSTVPKEKGALRAELPSAAEAKPQGAGFVPMQAKDFQKKTSWARVLSPEMVEQLQAARAAAAAPSAPPAPAPVIEPTTSLEPAPDMTAEAPPPLPPNADGVLSEDEVQQLLNS